MKILLSHNRALPPSDGWTWFNDNWNTNLAPIEPATVTELVAEHVLDRMAAPSCYESIGYWVRLLAHGGKLTVAVTDFEAITRAYLKGEVDLNFLSSRLCERRSLHALEVLVDVMKGMGLKVTARLEGYAAVIVGQRP